MTDAKTLLLELRCLKTSNRYIVRDLALQEREIEAQVSGFTEGQLCKPDRMISLGVYPEA